MHDLVSPLLERVAIAALGAWDAIVSRAAIAVRTNVDVTERMMVRHPDVLSWSRPAGGATAFPWFMDARYARPFCERLAQAGVLVAPGDCFGHPSHFRIGFGGEPELFAQALGIPKAFPKPSSLKCPDGL